MDNLPCLHLLADGSLLLRLHVQPRAAGNGVAGLQGDMLKIRLAAPPVDGKANEALIHFLAKTLDIARSAICLKSGQTSRRKVLEIQANDKAVIAALIR